MVSDDPRPMFGPAGGSPARSYLYGPADPQPARFSRTGAMPPAASRVWWLPVVLGYIEQKLDEELTLGTLAALTRMSAFHFARSFKQAVGLPPHRYVIRRRIERVKRLLRTTDLSLVEIALMTGFSSQSHMTTVFRRLVALSPGAWRAAWQLKSV